jgi:Ecdysteroid kinase-like family
MAGNWNDIAKELRRAAAINRIGRNVAWELIGNPRPIDLTEVPHSTQALTPEYLTHVMCRDHPGAKVTGIELGVASSGSGNRCAFTVSYNAAGDAAGLQKHLFHKYSSDFFVRLHLRRLDIDRNEHSFYSIIRPELDIETPRAYRSAFDERSCRLSIIMDDIVATQGVRFFEVATPITRADLEGMLVILADTHATFWNSPRLHSEFTWLMDPKRYAQKLIEGMDMRELTRLGFERAQRVIPAGMKGRVDDVWEAFMKSMDMNAVGELTYVIGDPHLRNFYRKPDGKIGFCDWQVTMKSGWCHDFAYTMLTSLPIASRRAWEKELLRFYLDRVKAKGGNPPAFEEAWGIYRRQTMYTFVGWLITIGFGALQPSMQPDSESLAIIERAAAAAEDLDTLALLLGERAAATR